MPASKPSKVSRSSKTFLDETRQQLPPAARRAEHGHNQLALAHGYCGGKLVVGAYVFRRAPKAPLNRAFGLLALATSCWAVALAVGYHIDPQPAALSSTTFIIRFAFAAGSLFAVLFLLFDRSVRIDHLGRTGHPEILSGSDRNRFPSCLFLAVDCHFGEAPSPKACRSRTVQRIRCSQPIH